MKLINSADIENLFEDKDDVENLFNCESSPCWEARVDRDSEKLLLLVNNEEIMVAPLSNFPNIELSVDDLIHFIGLLRENNLEQLKKELGI